MKKQLVLLFAVLICVAGLIACHGSNTIPQLPTGAALQGDVKHAAGTAYGVINSTLKVLNDASKLEETERIRLMVPPNPGVDTFFRETASALKAINDDIERRVLTSWDQIAAKVNPIFESINAFIKTPHSPGAWLNLLSTVANVLVQIL